MGGDSLLVEAFRRRRLLRIPARKRGFLLTVYKRACIFTSRISGGRPRSDRNPTFCGGRLTCSRPERGDTYASQTISSAARELAARKDRTRDGTRTAFSSGDGDC